MKANTPNTDKDYYLKKELYGLVKKDNKIFDFIQNVCLDGLWFWDLEKPKNESERLKELESYQLIGLPEKKDHGFTLL